MTWHCTLASGIPHGFMGQALMIYKQDNNGAPRMIGRFSFVEVQHHSFKLEDAAIFSEFAPFDSSISPEIRGFLQACVDEAWRLGIRAADHTDRTPEITALNAHLQDMRKLAKVT